MAYNTDGTWTPENDSVESKLQSVTDASGPLMDAARTGAKQYANNRGLLNSSLAATAGESAALGVAVPIASQDATQTAQKNLSAQQLQGQQTIAGMNVASNDRQRAQEAISQFGNAYSNSFASIVNNPNIPEATRNAYLGNIATLRDQDINLMTQLYGITLDVPNTPGALPTP